MARHFRVHPVGAQRYPAFSARTISTPRFDATNAMAGARGQRPCRHCNNPNRLMLDLSAISGYAVVPWGDGHAHWAHIAEEFMAAPSLGDGSLGEAYVQTFLKAIRAVEKVIELATAANDFGSVLEAANTLAKIGEMQAGIVGHLPTKGSRKGPPVPVLPPMDDDEFAEVLGDARAVENAGAEGMTGGPDMDAGPAIEP